MTYQEIITFWFEETDPSLWFQQDADFDKLITRKFSATHFQAAQCQLYRWRITPLGRLAEIIILDQFSRNIFRDSSQSFGQDSLALALAQEGIAQGADQQLNQQQKIFFYMPFMHSESLVIHEVAEVLFKDNGAASSLEFERKHKRIIEQFGRYPHRNKLLGRQSTDKEKVFLSSGRGF